MDCKGDQVVFLVGARRSGTTLLRILLNAHPEIAWVGEFNYATKWIKENKIPDIQAYHRCLQQDRVFSDHELNINIKFSYSKLLQSFVDQTLEKTNKRIFGATVHDNFDDLLQFWPNAKFIHLVRDGRDVALSSMRIGWFGTPYSASFSWVESEKRWESLKNQLNSKQFLNIRYEDFISYPEIHLSRICDFLNVSYGSDMIRAVDKTSYHEPDPKNIYKWKSLDSKSVQEIESVQSQMLVEREYSLSGLPVIQFSKLRILLNNMRNRFLKIKNRIKKYGFKIFLLEFLFRKLSLSHLYFRIRLEMNKIEKKHLQ